MVGHNCLANYIQLASAESIAEFYSDFIVSLETFNSEDESNDERINSGHCLINIVDFLAYAKIIVAEKGYVSSKNETFGNLKTSTIVCNEFFYTGKNKINITDDDKQQAESIVTIVKNELSAKKNLTDYEFNILTLIDNGKMKINHAGYIVSIIPLYNRIMGEVKTQTTDKKESSFIGEVGSKINNVPAIVTFYNRYDTQYGYTHLYKFNSNDNVITYFSSKDLDLEVGQAVTILQATVKAHDIYNNTNQTVITRGKIK
jgi:hypothetical protein